MLCFVDHRLFYISSFFHVVIVLSVLRFSVSSHPFSSFQWGSCYPCFVDHCFVDCVVCLSMIVVFQLSLGYLQTFHNPVKFKTTYVCRINSQSDWCPTLFCSCIYLCPIGLKYNDKKKRRYHMQCARRVSEITFIRYAKFERFESQIFLSFGSNKPNGLNRIAKIG